MNILFEALHDATKRDNIVYYCSLIHDLLIDAGTIAPGVLPTLCQLPLDGSPLFYGVRRLFWTESSCDSGDIFRVIGIRMERLTMVVHKDYWGVDGVEAEYTHWVQRLLAKVSALSPSLQHLSLTSDAIGPTHSSDCREYFRSLHRSRVYVYVKDAHGKCHPEPLPTPTTVASALKEFRIKSNQGSHSVLNCIAAVALRPEVNLRIVHLHLGHFAPRDHGRSELLKHIPGLLSLRRLTDVTIILGSVFPGICFGDNDLFRLAETWPFIENLKLSFRQDMCVTPPNVASLGSIASVWPSLARFTIPSMWGPQTHSALTAIKGPPSSKLSMLNLGRVYINTATKSTVSHGALIRAIHKAFPNMDGSSIYLEAIYVFPNAYIVRFLQPYGLSNPTSDHGRRRWAKPKPYPKTSPVQQCYDKII
ncbi:hypothetical protein C8Q79DRAFT_1011513 [Trametes meyenii]|nr:hypothetical protein C8Q79DRAFT_1011513 [Trametes meyenii]